MKSNLLLNSHADNRLEPWISKGLIFLGLCLAASQATLGQNLIPPSRLVDWTPGVSVGVSGGIPNRTNLIDVTKPPYNADKTGVADASSTIQSAINTALSNDVVYLPAGTYRLDNTLNLRSHISVRGAGQTNTLINLSGGAGAFAFQSYTAAFWDPSTSVQVTNGLTKGSANLIVGDTSGFEVGRILQVAQFNSTNQFDSPLVTGVGNNNGGNGWLRKQKTKIVSKTATTLTIFPPLYADLTARTVRAAAGAYQSNTGAGIEDLTINASNSTAVAVIFFEEVMNSWVKNVRVRWGRNYSVHLMDCLQCEVRECYLDELLHSGSNGAGLLFNASAACLVENCIIRNSFPGMEINGGSCGNVFGYNFLLNDNGLVAIDSNHGAHNSFNLYEGNVANTFQSDGYYGSASQDTVFRNWLHGKNTGYSTNDIGWCVSLNRFTRDYSLVGNVLGAAGYTMVNDGVSCGNPNMGNGSHSGVGPPWADWGKFPGASGYQELDTNVVATLVRKGNYNYFTHSIPTSESLGATELPGSLYRMEKPTWFGGLVWPPFDPANPSPSYGSIPAGNRYVNGTSQTGPPPPPPAVPPPPVITGVSVKPGS